MRSGRFLTKWPLVHQGGGGPHFPAALKHMRLVRHGCTNRPFYHIVIIMARRFQHDQPIEQLGTYDPLPNENGEKLVSLNIERIRYWLAHRTKLSRPVAMLLGLSGFLPMHPCVYIRAWHNRKQALEEKAEAKSKNVNEDMRDEVEKEQEEAS